MNGFGICAGLPFGICVAALIWTFWIRPRPQGLTRGLSSLNRFTFGVFLAGAIMFTAVHTHSLDMGDPMSWLRVFFLSVTDSIRLFVLGIDINAIEQAVPAEPAQIRKWFILYAEFMCLLAPFLTFTNVLAFFGAAFGTLRLRFCYFRKVCIMSELNVQSLALAQDIRARSHWPRPLIVFADVFARNEEADYELRQQARQINGICLKNDAVHLKFSSGCREVEIFLIGNNETENIAQAKALTEKHKDKDLDISIYVYASAPYADHILDSLDLGDHMLNSKFQTWLREKPEDILYGSEWMSRKIPMGDNFTVRRIDPVDMLVRQVLVMNDYNDYKEIHTAAAEDKTVSVTLLGMGRYGSHFLKTAVWFYQRYGYRVEINVFDLGEKNGDPEHRLAQECPELLSKARAAEDDEAQYDIRFFTGVDCRSDVFRNAVLADECDRLGKTKLVFIALGDDDTNIQTAMTVRTLFDQLHLQQGRKPTDTPFIYTLVYDDQKVSNLKANSLTEGLKNHKDESYSIRFVGALEAQYSYETIEKNSQREAEAFKWHLDWARKESQLRNYYEHTPPKVTAQEQEDIARFRAELDAELAQSGVVGPEWYDADLIWKDPKSGKEKVNVQKLKEKAVQYMKYAYYRNSSIAKAFHKEAIDKLPDRYPEHWDLCSCEACRIKRITEHMRWNAYIRSQGFSVNPYNDRRYTRGKLHPDLKPWKDIPCRERYKD